MLKRLGLMASAGMLLACTAGEGSSASVSVRLAALSLPGISDVCWDLAVTDATGATAWQATSVCSSTHGDRAATAVYVGPCDPDAPEPRIVATLTSLSVDGEPLPVGAWANPCADGCEVPFSCAADTITPVSVDVTIGRPLLAGVTTVTPTLGELACDASVSCADVDGRPLVAPFGLRGGAPAVVVSVACALPAAQAAPWLYWESLDVVCAQTSANVALDEPSGLASASPVVGWTARHTLSSRVDSGWSTEAFVVLATDPTSFGDGCALRGLVTVTPDRLDGDALDASASWPAVRFDVPLAAEGGAPCGRLGLGDAGVQFEMVVGPLPFSFAFDGFDVFRIGRDASVAP